MKKNKGFNQKYAFNINKNKIKIYLQLNNQFLKK